MANNPPSPSRNTTNVKPAHQDETNQATKSFEITHPNMALLDVPSTILQQHNRRQQKQQRRRRFRRECGDVDVVKKNKKRHLSVVAILVIITVMMTASISFLSTVSRRTNHSRRQLFQFLHAEAFQSFPSSATKSVASRTILRQQQQQLRLGSSSSSSSSHYQSADDTLSTSSSSNKIRLTYVDSSNEELVQRRIGARREKRERWIHNRKERAARNLEIKRLLHVERTTTSHQQQQQQQQQIADDEEDSTSSLQASLPSLYQVKVWVDDELRREMKLTGRERRGRVFIDSQSNAIRSLKDFKQELHGFFRALRKDTYILRAQHPRLSLTTSSENNNDDGATCSTSAVESLVGASNALQDSWGIESDEDVVKTFMAADSMFMNSSLSAEPNDIPAVKRPSIQINVLKNPKYEPPPIPQYLVGMEDPTESESMTMLSFYAFPPSPGIIDPERFATDLKRIWRPFNALGRVYVAQEGINAQMAVPTSVLQNFMDCAATVPEFQHMENGINIDPKPLSKDEFAVAGVPVNGKPSPPFRNLHIRVRRQVVADGLDKALDWSSAGYDMPPLEWHEKLRQAAEAKSRPDKGKDVPIILDCRNTYETDVGIFEGAEPLGTQNFRDSWDVLKERLADTPKDAPIMTYCTGGIRCVKVGAYLTQELGFSNVSRLAGGIIAYDRKINEVNDKQMKDKAQTEASLFKGTNFVFDGRVGRQITSDALSNCVTCGAETSLVSNCRNDNCHIRIIQCEKCRTSFHGTCSQACRNRVVNGGMVSRRVTLATDEKKEEAEQGLEYDSIDSYVTAHSSPVPLVYDQIDLNTQHHLANGAHMVSGASQGQLLKLFASISRSGRVLEAGTFTGYATACLLEGAQLVGSVRRSMSPMHDDENEARNSGPYVLSLERDQRAFSLAVAQMKVITRHGFGEEASAELQKLRSSDHHITEVKESLVSLKTPGGLARLDLLRVNDALATVESLAEGSLDFSHGEPFDLVFVDADKGRLIEYADACLGNNSLLRPGGTMIVDNTLWKGLVLEAAMKEFKSLVDDTEATDSIARKNRRARKLANQMHAFNAAIVKDPRAEVTMLPIRDGLTIVRKK